MNKKKKKNSKRETILFASEKTIKAKYVDLTLLFSLNKKKKAASLMKIRFIDKANALEHCLPHCAQGCNLQLFSVNENEKRKRKTKKKRKLFTGTNVIYIAYDLFFYRIM